MRAGAGPRRGAALQELGLVNDGALLIRDGLIVDVGPTRRIENLSAARQAMDIDASGRVVMPALIDSEVQLLTPALAAHETTADALSPDPVHDPWDAVGRKLAAHSSRHFGARARALLERMARHGTGQVEALSGFALDASGSFKALRIQPGTDRQPLDVISAFLATPTPDRGSAHNKPVVEQVCRDILPVISRRQMARFIALAVGPGDLQNGLFKRIVSASRESGLGIKILCDPLDPRDGVQLSMEERVASVSHLGRARRAQIRQVATISCIALLTCSEAEVSGGDLPAVARALVEEGAAIALGTGFRPSANGTYSMQHVLYIAVAVLGLKPAEALSAATINAAFSHGTGAEAGSLEPGKRADFIILNVGDYRDLFVHPGVNAVHLMVKAGRVRYLEADVGC